MIFYFHCKFSMTHLPWLPVLCNVHLRSDGRMPCWGNAVSYYPTNDVQQLPIYDYLLQEVSRLSSRKLLNNSLPFEGNELCPQADWNSSWESYKVWNSFPDFRPYFLNIINAGKSDLSYFSSLVLFYIFMFGLLLLLFMH